MSILFHLEEMLVVTEFITFILLKWCVSFMKWFPTLTTFMCCNSSDEELLYRCCTTVWTEHILETILSFCTNGEVLKNKMGNLYERLFVTILLTEQRNFSFVDWLQRSCKRNSFCTKFKPWLMLLTQWNFIVFSAVIWIYIAIIGMSSSEISFCSIGCG